MQISTDRSIPAFGHRDPDPKARLSGALSYISPGGSRPPPAASQSDRPYLRNVPQLGQLVTSRLPPAETGDPQSLRPARGLERVRHYGHVYQEQLVLGVALALLAGTVLLVVSSSAWGLPPPGALCVPSRTLHPACRGMHDLEIALVKQRVHWAYAPVGGVLILLSGMAVVGYKMLMLCGRPAHAVHKNASSHTA